MASETNDSGTSTSGQATSMSKRVSEMSAEELDEAAMAAHRREKQAITRRAIEAENQATVTQTALVDKVQEHARQDGEAVEKLNAERALRIDVEGRYGKFKWRSGVAIVLVATCWAIDHYNLIDRFIS